MYDKDKLKEELTLDEIKTLLVELGVQHIETHESKGHIITNTICHNVSDGKMKLYYYIDEQIFHCYTSCNENFDIFDLVIKNHMLKGKKLGFPEAIHWVLTTLGRPSYMVKPKGFGHSHIGRREELDWLDSLKVKKSVILDMKVHSEKTLELFSDKPHPLFLEDNITEDTMRKFEVMYYEKTNRIVIPHRHYQTGKLIGVKSRSLDFQDIDNGYKYIPLRVQDVTYSYPTFQNLYGLYQNKDIIKRLKRVVIFESEKSVMQFESYFPNYNFSVALCGSNVSKQQVQMLVELGVQEVVLALDKEFTILNTPEANLYREKLERLCSMFSSYCKVSMIWDRFKLLELKDSPSDKGKEVFVELFKNRRTIHTKE
ncbi:hypothetical protein ACIQ1D_18940 [Lysinibacillus xylanilyticus]|uniref:hypothetical protein n=1 Tax=Lysinibacillus xylanilyticus TaxID=582475 RepID=UPI00381AB892